MWVYMKKIIIFIVIGVIIAAGLGVGLYFIFRNKAISADAETYVSISINPAVEFTVNDDNQVITAVATDEEGDQIIQSYDFYGMDIEDACEKFTELCITAGYVDLEADEDTVDPNEVVITVVNDDTDVEQNIIEKVTAKVNNYFYNNGIFGKVSVDTLDEYLTQAAEYGLSVGHIKLIMAALEYNPELSIEDLVAMPINEVVALTKTAHQNLERTTAQIRQQLKAEIQELKENETYEAMFSAMDAIDIIKDSLLESGLTEDQIATLEAQLESAEASFETLYSELLEQFKEDKSELIAESQVDVESLETIKDQYQARVQENKNQFENAKNNAKNNANNIKNRIKNWQDENTTED